MKILYLALDPRIPMDIAGGNVMRSLSTIEGFKKHGCQVELIARFSTEKNTMVGKTRKSGIGAKIKSVAPEYFWLLARDSYDIYEDLKSVRKIEEKIDSFKPDIIYDSNAYLKDAGFKAAKKRGVPYFIEINAPTSEERSENFGAPLGWFNNIKEYRRAREAAGAIVVSGVLKDILIEKGVTPEKIGIFHNGIDIKRFDIPIDERIKNKVAGCAPVIGFVGAIAAYHGLDAIYDAAEKLKSEYPNLLFWIIGPAENIGGLQTKAESMGLGRNIRFEGAVPAGDVPKYIKAFDIAFLPGTAYYCSPVKLFEYAAAGIPMIAPKTKPVVEIFGDNELAVLVNRNDDISEAIKKILADPEKARQTAIAAKSKIMLERNWEKIAADMIEFMAQRMG